MNSLVSSQDSWALWTILISAAALSILLEQKNKFAAKLTGPVIALIIGMGLSNIGVIPTRSATYDVLWEYIVPLAIPLLLIKVNIRKILRETGQMFRAFHISALGSVAGGVIAVIVLQRAIPEVAKLGGIMTASYIGGGVNFVAMVSTFQPTESLVNAAIVADNGAMAVYFLILIALPVSALVERIYPHIHQADNGDRDQKEAGGTKSFWKPKPISLLDIAVSLASAFMITMISVKLSVFFGNPAMPLTVRSILGQKYLLLTTVSIAVPIFFPRFADKIVGSEEIGTFFIFIFFVLIGAPASLKTVILNSPLLLLFCGLMLFVNFLVTFGAGKLFKLKLEELILAAAATSGGPMNAAAIAISKGWNSLIFPSFLVGIWGYVIGNYIGYAMGGLLISMTK